MSAEPEGPTWQRLESQIEWYDSHARSSQLWFKSLKTLEITLAAAIPVTAAAGAGVAVAGGLGALVVILEGLQQLFRFQTDWISYRSTCEALRREKYLYLAHAGPYGRRDDREQILALQVEALVSTETKQWALTQGELERARDQRPAT